jgi:hypothetical protein
MTTVSKVSENYRFLDGAKKKKRGQSDTALAEQRMKKIIHCSCMVGEINF